MKKLALVLSSVAMVSSVAMAKEVVPAPITAVEQPVAIREVEVIKEVKVQPDFRVTSINVKAYGENRDGNHNSSRHGKNDLVDGDGYFATTANFAYKKDWTGTLQVRRYFTSDTGGRYTSATEKVGGYEKGSIRGYATARRNNLELAGIKYSLEGTLEFRDRQDYYGVKLHPQFTPWFGGSYAYQYRAKSADGMDNNDTNFFELIPTFSYAGYRLAYYYEHETRVGGSKYENRISQVRLFTPNYKITNDLRLAFEYRGWLSADTKDNFGDDSWAGARGQIDKAFEMNRIYATTTYPLNASTTLRFQYGYEFGKYQRPNGSGYKKEKANMSIFDLGVTYRF